MRKFLTIIIFLLSVSSCEKLNRENEIDKTKLLGYDYRLFQNTKSWEIAKAVWDDDTEEIKRILLADSTLINLSDPVFGHTLLMFTIWHQQYSTFKYLLENGANVNLHDKYDGRSAIIEACGIPDINEKYIVALIKHGANINDIEVGERRKGNSTRYTPLLAASKNENIPLVKLLIQKKANLNFKNEYNHSALGYATTFENYYFILYLLNVGANPKQLLNYNKEQKRNYYLVDELRFTMPELGSEEHSKKKQIISFLKKKGIDYYSIPVPEYVLEKAKEKYPNDWKKYLEEY